MGSKYSFTFEELKMMIDRSTAMRAFGEEQRKSIIEQSGNPESEKAQALYSALIKEQEEYKLIRKDYITYTSRAMANFENEVESIKVHEMREARERAENAASKTEKEAAQNILQNLK